MPGEERSVARKGAFLRVALAAVFAAAAPALALGAAGGLLVACKKSSETSGGAPNGSSSSSSSGTGPSLLSPEQAAKVLARVGDKVITLGDFAAALEHLDTFDRLRYQSPERRKELLNEMINVELLAQEAEAKGYDKDPKVAQSLREILRDAMLADAKKGAPRPQDIPDAEVKAYFEAHRDEYKDPERRRIAVLVRPDAASATALLEAARKASPAEWGALVKSKSEGGGGDLPADLAGDVGFVSPPGDPRGQNPRVPEAVRAAAFTVEAVGSVLPRVVVADGKAYLVRLVQKVEARERTFAESERSIRLKLAQEKAREREEALLAELRKELPVQIDEAALGTVKVGVADAGLALPPLPPSLAPEDGGHVH